MASMDSALAVIHHARNLVQRIQSPSHEVSEGDLMEFLAISEEFLVEGCGVRARYLDKGGA